MFPGLRVCLPSTAQDAHDLPGMLPSACMRRSRDLHAVIDPSRSYTVQRAVDHQAIARSVSVAGDRGTAAGRGRPAR